MAVQVVVAPGAKFVSGQTIAERPLNGSVTAAAVSVVLPVLVTLKPYVRVSPFEIVVLESASVVSAADLTNERVEVCGIGVVIVDGAVTTGPVGGVPVADAEFTILAASTSAWVTRYVAVQVVLLDGANAVTGQVTGLRPIIGSATPTLVRVTLPVLVTLKL